MLLHSHTTLTHPHQDQTLYVIVVVSNPVGYKTRYRLLNEFAERMHDQNRLSATIDGSGKAKTPIHLSIVEAAFGERDHVAPAGHLVHQFRAWDELWLKENLINLGIARLPPSWQYVVWVDADIQFTNPTWPTQTINALQHHMLVQPWRDCIDLGPDGQTLGIHKSFAGQLVDGVPRVTIAANGGYYGYGDVGEGAFWHPGFAWAARREAIDHLGGLMDFPILGSADHHMAMAFIGDVMNSAPNSAHPAFKRKLLEYQDLATRHIREDIGVVPGTILHHWHGKKKDRKYKERWDILTKNQFNPDIDIKRNSEGVYQLEDHGDRRSISLRDGIRSYFRQRHEDSIDLE